MNKNTPVVRVETALVERREKILDLMPGRDIETQERFFRLAISEAKAPSLKNCNLITIIESVAGIAKLGLEPNRSLGHAWLIPRKGECTMQVGYRGLLVLARRSSAIRKIHAEVVYANDEFEEMLGSERSLIHRRWSSIGASNPGKLVGAYVTWIEGDSSEKETSFHTIGLERIERALKMGGAAWRTDLAAMARKTAIVDASKIWPLTVEMTELAQAVQWAEEEERGARSAYPRVVDETKLIDAYVDVPADEIPPPVEQAPKRKQATPPSPAANHPPSDDGPPEITEDELNAVLG